MWGVYTRRQIFAAGVLAALAGCRRAGSRVIGVVPKATSHLFFLSVHAGVEQAARELHVEVLWNGPQNETDFARQIEIVDAMITRQVAALAISATDEHALVAPIERAIRAGIPVTVFDSAVAIDDYVSFIATDNYAAGCTAARTLAHLIGTRGAVAMVMQKPGGTSTVLRERGFEATIAKEFPNVRIAAREFGMADPERSRAAAEDILTANPELAGMFASSEAASLGSIQAIRNRGIAGKLKLVTFDFSKTHVEALRDGTSNAMLVQNPFRLGYEAVKSLDEKLSGRTPPRRMELPARVILKDDLEKPDVRALLFPEWLKDQ
ncbi:MAG: substrate-binding domain-containing protein [Acidobacteriaceae bacterium]|nr:substrate-binding domain-containing protein [Acidobacteriaceae bacterium]